MMIDLTIKLKEALKMLEDIEPIMSEFPIPLVGGKEKDLRKEKSKTEKDLNTKAEG